MNRLTVSCGVITIIVLLLTPVMESYDGTAHVCFFWSGMVLYLLTLVLFLKGELHHEWSD